VTGTRASWQIRSTAATSPVVRGEQTAAAIWGTSPARAQCMASGHQSRLASARSTAVTPVGQAAASWANTLSSGSNLAVDRCAAVPVSSMGDVGVVTDRLQ
jgi:hypothetical protein